MVSVNGILAEIGIRSVKKFPLSEHGLHFENRMIHASLEIVEVHLNF